MIGIKDVAKFIGISIISCCAVVVCTMFLNFYFDILQIKELISSKPAMIFYNAQASTAKVVCLVSGGCLFITSVVMLIFYIKQYIDNHKKELGILKALGYSNFKIAKSFWVFGISVFIGSAIGFAAAFILMPVFYETQNKDKIFPEILMNFHGSILIYFVVLPSLIFALLSVLYAFLKLRMPVIYLLKEKPYQKSKSEKKISDKSNKSCSFICDLRKHTLSSRKTLVFFITFASFCFSAMTQMSAGMEELSSVMMSLMILIIGLVLACTTLFIAITTVINGNIKTVAMMHVFGYSQNECFKSILSGYRPFAYFGFVLGTVYQYALLRIMVDIVFKDIEGVPEYKFDVPVMLMSLLLFILFYELMMYFSSQKIKKISIKEIMTE